ncbi:hypothetical protein PHYPSEUDO_015484 [Phytophthora pseudosyringae]|uniref:Uncharacterized protein n=1 Tax=Phytophthora pseudosyringae TaxID=221518 RepID=A0A8T1W049_9STRA|nr:hypothetical protein PHYPSEUDO_015484 [Phytophthora pseudosyringae]
MTGVCEHVVAHVVTPRSDILIYQCVSESGLHRVGSSGEMHSTDRRSEKMLHSLHEPHSRCSLPKTRHLRGAAAHGRSTENSGAEEFPDRVREARGFPEQESAERSWVRFEGSGRCASFVYHNTSYGTSVCCE